MTTDKKAAGAKSTRVLGRLAVVWDKLSDTGRIRRAAVALWMNVLIAAVVGLAALTTGLVLPTDLRLGPGWAQRVTTLFLIWLLAFLPGWLYVRFLCLRRDALWNEYVLTLFRLRLDEPEYLPPPPAESAYARLPGARHGGEEKTNIYRQKFNAYYGRKMSPTSQDSAQGYAIVDTLFPVFLCTVTLAVAWTVILWNPVVIMAPLEPWATLEFGFFGAYTFAVSMLVRRFYQSDLRPSAYAAVIIRIIVVLIILAAVHELFVVIGVHGRVGLATEYVSSFVVGFFPLVGLQALQRLAAKALRVVVPSMNSDYPLDQLDGLNIWYEARLIEEGVEDMQNLITVNLVDVILHTRAPVGRLIDWIDQAFLLVRLNPASRKEIKTAVRSSGTVGSGAAARVALRQIGIRTATDLVRAFAPGFAGDRLPIPAETLRARQLDPDELVLLAGLLAAEPGLDPVWNWRAGGALPLSRPHATAEQTAHRTSSPRSQRFLTGAPHARIRRTSVPTRRRRS